MNALTIGYNIRRWRQFKGIKQTEMAQQLNISRSTLSRLENGKGDFNLSILGSIAAVLGVDINALLTVN